MNTLLKLLRSPSSARPKNAGCERLPRRRGLTAPTAERELEGDERPEKLAAKPPFLKNLFAGKFDADYLVYPEPPLPAARLDRLNERVDAVRRLTHADREAADAARIDRRGVVPPELVAKLRDLRLYGTLGSRAYGGDQLAHTERARLLEAVAAAAGPSVAASLFAHETLGYRLLERYGDARLKDAWLPPLMAGRKRVALCFGEERCGSDASQFETHVVRSAGGGDGSGDWLLRGRKVWVMNADAADVFVVAAKVRPDGDRPPPNPYYAADDDDDLVPEDLGFFLVERDAGHLTVGQPLDTVGLRGLSACEVTFDGVVVPARHALTERFAGGYDMAARLLTDERYAVGCVATAVMRDALRDSAEYCATRQLHGHPLHAYEFAQHRLGRMLLNLYVAESMVYYTAGLLDTYRDHDCELENAATKVFATEAAAAVVDDARLLAGGRSLLEGSPFDRHDRDARALAALDHHNDAYRARIALAGLQYVSNALAEVVMVNRNPLHYSWANARYWMRRRYVAADDERPLLHLRLREHAHPSLMYATDRLEHCALRFQHVVVKTLSMQGVSVAHSQFYWRRLADCAVALYAMTAALSRASRACRLRAPSAADETLLAETFVRESQARLAELFDGLQYGEYYVTDYNYKKMSSKVVEKGGYFPTEPLRLNY